MTIFALQQMVSIPQQARCTEQEFNVSIHILISLEIVSYNWLSITRLYDKDQKWTSILVPPMFWIPSQLEGAYVGQDVTIECHSEAFPDSINYWVKKDGVMLLLSKSLLCVLLV